MFFFLETLCPVFTLNRSIVIRFGLRTGVNQTFFLYQLSIFLYLTSINQHLFIIFIYMCVMLPVLSQSKQVKLGKGCPIDFCKMASYTSQCIARSLRIAHNHVRERESVCMSEREKVIH